MPSLRTPVILYADVLHVEAEILASSLRVYIVVVVEHVDT